MNKAELINKLQDIEWEDFEVKEAKSELPKNVWETISAFSNTSGGWLVLGVKEAKKGYEITGIENPKKIETDFLSTIRTEKFNRPLKAKIRKYNIDGNIVFAIHIPAVSEKYKPIFFNSEVNTFFRTGSGDQRATHEEIAAIRRDSSFGEKDSEKTEFTVKYLDKESIERYRIYLKEIDPNHRYNSFKTEEFLEKLNVTARKKVTVAGLLVFGKEEALNRFMSDFRIDYLEIQGTSYEDAPERYKYRLPTEKNLYNYYFSIFDRLIRKIEIPFKLKSGGFRDENQPQVGAIREALVNLLMHTDYFSNAKPRIRVLSDRIEFFNPGALPKDIKIIIREECSLPRNPTIAKIFRVIRLSENIGSGFHKMIDGWYSHYKVKPIVSGDVDFYKIIFPLGKKVSLKENQSGGVNEGVKVPEKVTVKVPEKVTVNQSIILDNIRKNPNITTKELANIIGISERKTKENISKLKDKNLIKRVGPDKGGHWEVIE
ncbi:MAG: RNA-binding domain-containing protein [Candidatus Firestonebacteria bacterium]